MADRPKMENMVNKRVLVTGGAGFIGGHLAQALVRRGYSVCVLDIQKPGKTYFFLEHLDSSVDYRRIDIRDGSAVDRIFEEVNPDSVIHLAAFPVVEEAFIDPRGTFETNIMGSVNILEACRKQKSIRRVVIASSDKAYGKTTREYTEESPLRGDHPYDVSKSCEDLIAYTYFKTYGLPVAITRFGNVYGEGDLHFDRIVPGICQSLALAKPLRVRSDGTYIRDYIYVQDVVRGYLLLLESSDEVNGEAFNFSSQDTYSVVDLIKKMEELLQQKIPYRIQNSAKNEIPYQHLNDTKVRILGWKPVSTLESTAQKVFEWYKKYV